MTGLTKTVVALVVMVCLVGAARGQEQDNSQTIDLTDELSKTSAGIVTPSRLLAGRNKWTGKGVPMTLTVAGHDVMARIDPAHFGVDTNRDGAVSTQEREVTRGKDEHIFKIRIEDGPDGQKRYIGVIFKEVHPSGRSGAYSGRMAPASCKTATIDGVIVRIYDDNMDGKYTVDGSDAVAIGESAKGAAPLYPANKIGKGFYELAIAEDGSTLTVTPMVNPETALVSMSTDPDKYITVIITDGTKACDLTQVSEMLSGEYKLLYAAAAGAKNVPIIIIPSDKAVTYDVEANKTNELQFGEPLWVWYSGEMNGMTLRIHRTKILGAGGEHYLVKYQLNASPGKIAVFKGRKVYIGGMMRGQGGSSTSFRGDANIEIPADAELQITATVKGLGTAETRTTVDIVADRKCPNLVAEEPVIYGVRY